MATNVDVKKKKKDTNMSLLRTFTRKVKQSGILRKKRSQRFFQRKESEFRKKMNALMRIKKRKEYEKAVKLGLIKSGR